MKKNIFILHLMILIVFAGSKRAESYNNSNKSSNQFLREYGYRKEVVVTLPEVKLTNADKLKLPIEINEPVEFEIKAYSTIVLPGSSDKIVIEVGIIIDGKISTSVSWRYGNIIVAREPMRQSDRVHFAVYNHVYTLELIELIDYSSQRDIIRYKLSYAGTILSEKGKIEKLLLMLKDVKDALVVENGEEYTAKQTHDFLITKWETNKKEIKKAQDFINLIGSKSSTTGNDYIIRHSVGSEIALGKWFQNNLKIIEKKKLKIVDIKKGQRVRYGSSKEPGEPLKNIVRITAGDHHNLALKKDGTIAGWGWNDYDNAVPPDGNNFIAIAAGWFHSLALKSDGSIIEWGSEIGGKASTPEGNDYSAIKAGGNHYLALKADGSIVGWGSNALGQAKPPRGNDFVAIAAGRDHSVALKSDGSIVCWGSNLLGQTRSPSGKNFVAISAGSKHSLALKADGSVIGWGLNLSGQATPEK